MARGENAERKELKIKDREWWGKRPYRFFTVSVRSKTNKFFKRQLHKVERQEGKKDCEKDGEL